MQLPSRHPAGADDRSPGLPLRARRRPLPPHRPDPRPVGSRLPARRPARRPARAGGGAPPPPPPPPARPAGAARPPGPAGRLGYDILRPVPAARHRVETRTLRPGRNVEQIEATLTDAAGGDALMRLTAWRLRSEELALPDGLALRDGRGKPDPPPPSPAAAAEGPVPAFWTEPVAYHAALEWRFVNGD